MFAIRHRLDSVEYSVTLLAALAFLCAASLSRSSDIDYLQTSGADNQVWESMYSPPDTRAHDLGTHKLRRPLGLLSGRTRPGCCQPLNPSTPPVFFSARLQGSSSLVLAAISLSLFGD